MMDRNRRTIQPVPAASIAVFRDEDVLLVQRASEPMAGIWTLPGGHIEFGETAAAAVLRELAEETGVTARLHGVCDVVDVIRHDAAKVPRQHFVILVFAAAWMAGEPVAGSDSAAALFVPRITSADRPHTPRLPEVLSRAWEVHRAAMQRSTL